MAELFASRRSIGASPNTANVKRWVRELFVLCDDATVMVTELRCSDWLPSVGDRNRDPERKRQSTVQVAQTHRGSGGGRRARSRR